MLLLPGEKLEGFMEGPRFRNFPIVSDVPPPSPSGNHRCACQLVLHSTSARFVTCRSIISRVGLVV